MAWHLALADRHWPGVWLWRLALVVALAWAGGGVVALEASWSWWCSGSVAAIMLALAARQEQRPWWWRGGDRGGGALGVTAGVGLFTGSLQQGLIHTFIVTVLAVLGAQRLKSIGAGWGNNRL